MDASFGAGPFDEVLAIIKPEFQKEHSHEVPGIDEAEHGHG
jgi:hypothetical protein